jgi:hypothetical protein
VIVVFADLRCDCQRGITRALLAEDADATPEAIAAAYWLAGFAVRLIACARGWAVKWPDTAVCELCVDRPDAGTVYQDRGDDA